MCSGATSHMMFRGYKSHDVQGLQCLGVTSHMMFRGYKSHGLVDGSYKTCTDYYSLVLTYE